MPRRIPKPFCPIGPLTTLSAVVLALFALTGCNTIEGIGEDFEAAGEGVQNVFEGEDGETATAHG